jgi:hypothetical protein
VRWTGFFRNPGTGRLVIAQWPNPPLWASLGATLLGWTLVAFVALVVWSVLEIWKGESPFRRVLGAVVLVGATMGRVAR